jgi:hypothetical protein
MERGEGRGEIGEYRGGEGKDDSLRSSPEGEGAGGWATQRRCVSAARERERARVSFPTSWLVDGSPGEPRGKVRVNSFARLGLWSNGLPLGCTRNTG